MSLPRRTPPSQMISVRPPTASATGATSANGGGRAVELAAAVVRQRDRVDAGVGREHRVVDGLDALEHDRAVPHRAQPVDVVPRQRGIELGVDVVRERDRRRAVADVAADDVGEADRLAAHERPRPRRVQRAVDDRARPDGRRQREAAAHVALAPAEHRGVDGEHERLVVAPPRPGRSSPSTSPRSRQAYTWNHSRPSLTARTSSIERVLSVDSVYGSPARVRGPGDGELALRDRRCG